MNLADLDDSLDPRELNVFIESHLEERLAIYKSILSKQEYVQAMQVLPDIYMEYFCVLTKTGIVNRQWLWLLVLHRLTGINVLLFQAKTKFSSISDTHISIFSGAQSPLFQQVARYCETYFEGVDASFLADNMPKEACTKFLQMTRNSLDLFIPEPHSLKHGSFVASASSALLRLYQVVCEKLSKKQSELLAFKVESLPALVELGKCSFNTGYSSAILPLVFSSTSTYVPISESFVPSIALDPKVTLSLINDYYRYYAFCLVTCAVEGIQIHEESADTADIFLKVLLSFPHLSLANYMAEANSTNEAEVPRRNQLISGTDREEISFFYLLNSLLRLRSLSDFVDPDPAFIKERAFFIASFNKRCGAELDFSASASSSRTGSVVSMTRYADMRGVSQNKSHVNSTLSSILSEGSYKEKVRLVAEFFNLTSETGGAGSIKRLIETFDMSGLHYRTNHFSSSSHDVSRIFNRIDPQQNPGKVAYVKALDMIARLFQLVSLKFFRALYGPHLNAAELLSSQFKTNYSLRDILSVKPLLAVDKDQVVTSQNRVPTSEAEYLLKQFCIVEATQSLKVDAQKLV